MMTMMMTMKLGRWWQDDNDDLSTIVPSGKSTAAVTNLFLYQVSIFFHCFSLLVIVNVQQFKIPPFQQFEFYLPGPSPFEP